MNERDREGLLKIIRDALIANDTARRALLDIQARLRTHGARYEGPVGEPRMVAGSVHGERELLDPEGKRQRIRDNVRFRLEHGNELLRNYDGHLSDFTLDPDFQDPEFEAGKPL